MTWNKIQELIDAGKNPTVEEVWNAAIEAAADVKHNIFEEARDTDWDLGFNYARDLMEKEIRKLKK